jgi:hypothetical protein
MKSRDLKLQNVAQSFEALETLPVLSGKSIFVNAIMLLYI